MSGPLRKLPANALLALSDYLAELSRETESLGRSKDLSEGRKRMQRRKACLLEAGQIVDHYATHMSLERAVRMVADQTGLPVETVGFHARNVRRDREQRERFERDRRIMALARKGWSNAEIGVKVGLHPSSVSRIVQRQLSGPR